MFIIRYLRWCLRRIGGRLTAPAPHVRGSCNTSQSRSARAAIVREPLFYSTHSAADLVIAKALASSSIIEDGTEVLLGLVVSSIETDDEQDSPYNDTNKDAQSSLIVKPADQDDKLSSLRDGLFYEYKYHHQLSECKRMVDLGWSDDTILLYLKIERRQYEQYFAPSWQQDFPLFPQHLYASTDEEAFIRSITRPDFHAIKATDDFYKTGEEVRISVQNHTWPGRRPAAIIHNRLKSYFKWIWNDAGLLQPNLLFLPRLLTVVCAHPQQRTDQVEAMILSKLRAVSNMLKHILKKRNADSTESYIIPVPTILGLVVYDTVVGAVAYEPLSGRDELRTIAFYRFDDQATEVWHTLSISVIIHYARNGMLRIKDALDRQDQSSMMRQEIERKRKFRHDDLANFDVKPASSSSSDSSNGPHGSAGKRRRVSMGQRNARAGLGSMVAARFYGDSGFRDNVATSDGSDHEDSLEIVQEPEGNGTNDVVSNRRHSVDIKHELEDSGHKRC